MGAEYIEPDLVSTKDGVLVARHENEIGGTTDVAAHPEFASLRTTKTIDGNAVTGWFTGQSFETANLKQLDGMTKVPLVQLLDGSGKPYDFVLAGDPRTYADLATPKGSPRSPATRTAWA